MQKWNRKYNLENGRKRDQICFTLQLSLSCVIPSRCTLIVLSPASSRVPQCGAGRSGMVSMRGGNMGRSPEESRKMSGKVDFSQSRNTDVAPRQRRVGDAWRARRGYFVTLAGSRVSVSQTQTLTSTAGVKIYKVCFCSGPLGGSIVPFPLGTTMLDSPYRCIRVCILVV